MKIKEKTTKKVPHIMQMQQTECGLCCCAMLLRYYKSNESLSELREFIEIGRDGTTLNQLKSLLINKGFDAKVYKGSVNAIKTINLPAIIFWKNEHFVVLEQIKDGSYYIVDPAMGRQKLSEKQFEMDYSGYMLCAQPTDRFIPQKQKRKSVWLDILANISERKLLFFETFILSIICYFITLMIPVLVQKLIDEVVTVKTLSSLKKFVLTAIVITCLFAVFVFVRGIKIISLNLFLGRKLEAGTFLHMLSLPYKFFDSRASGDLLFRLGSLKGIRELISSQLVGGIIDFGAIIFIVGYMSIKSIPLTILAVAIFAANMLFMFLIRKPISEAINNEIVEQSRTQAIQVEALFSISAVKLSGMEEEIYSSWYTGFNEVLSRFKKRSDMQNIFNTVNGSVKTIAPLIILITGLFLYIGNIFTLGEVIAFQTLSITFFGLSTSLFGSYTQYLLATSYLDRVADVLDAKCEPKPENPIKHELTGEIKLENVSFSFTKHAPEIIKNINIHIKKGQKVAIVGVSGSGKSTLSKILVGLYTPTSGNVFYDGIRMQDFDKKELCKQMGIVPQDIALFNKSILKNIVMNNEEMPIENVKRISSAVQIAYEIEKMPMGYYTMVSEMGMNLSGRQRQRIAMARALINDPKIIILDEAASSLDSINESKISEYLSNMGCTRIVIAHRLSTIIDSDLIYVMDNGEIVEQGTHDDLMNLKGVYSRLYVSTLVEV